MGDKPESAPGLPLLWSREQHGPLPLLLLVLTFVTGLVDALSFLGLGRVFVANMTGNVVFLGFAVAGAGNFSIAASAVAIAAFLAGALVGGKLGALTGAHRGRYFAVATYCQIALLAAAVAVSLVASGPTGNAALYTLIPLLAAAMGLQNAAARRLAVPDLTTTVLTLTLTGIAADSALAGGRDSHPGRRVLAAATMFIGAAVGAFVFLRVGFSAVLLLVLGVQLANGIAVYPLASSTAVWTTERRA